MILDADGKRILNPDGKLVESCVPAAYYRALICLGDIPSIYLLPAGDGGVTSLPYYFTYGGDCLHVPEGAATTTVTTGATILDPAHLTTITDCNDAACNPPTCGCTGGTGPEYWTVDLSAVTFCTRSCSECPPLPGSGGVARGQANGVGSATMVCLRKISYREPNGKPCEWAEVGGEGPPAAPGDSVPMNCPGGGCCTWAGWWTFQGFTCPNPENGDPGGLAFCTDYYITLTVDENGAKLGLSGGFAANCDVGPDTCTFAGDYFGSIGFKWDNPDPDLSPFDCSGGLALTCYFAYNESCGYCAGGGGGHNNMNLACAVGATATITPTAGPCGTVTGCGCNANDDYCVYHWTVTHDCLADTWSDVTQVGSTVCRSAPAGYRGAWRRTVTSGATHTYEMWQIGAVCGDAGGCETPSPPARPDLDDAACCDGGFCAGVSGCCTEIDGPKAIHVRLTIDSASYEFYLNGYESGSVAVWVTDDSSGTILCNGDGSMDFIIQLPGTQYWLRACGVDGCPPLTIGAWKPFERNGEAWDGSGLTISTMECTLAGCANPTLFTLTTPGGSSTLSFVPYAPGDFSNWVDTVGGLSQIVEEPDFWAMAAFSADGACMYGFSAPKDGPCPPTNPAAWTFTGLLDGDPDSCGTASLS